MFGMTESVSSTAPPPASATDTAAPFGFTFGSSHTQSAWSDFRRLTWPQLVELLTSHRPGPKEGSCIVPAQFSGARRHKDDAARIDVAFLDSDSGMPLVEIEAALVRRGWEAVISSTHSHMATTTRVKTSNWDRFFGNNPNATAEDFLIHDKGYLSTVAAGAQPVATEADYVTIEHQPCPKFRVAIPLDRPWQASDYPSQAAANAVWKERIEALSAALGLDHDQACTDTSRLFYLPRRPANGVVPETAVVAGSHCDIFALPKATPAINGDLLHVPVIAKQPIQVGNLEYVDPVEGEVINLTDWAKASGGKFLIAKALKARHPSSLTGRVTENKVHIDCPNQGAHTDPARDGATYVVNGGKSSTKGFVIHCRHAHCTGRDRLVFLKQMLEERWLSIADLHAKEFLGEEPDKAAEDQPSIDLPLLWFNDIHPVLDARDFIQGVLLEQGAVVIYGESGAGKTFWATDLSLHAAAGLTWCRRRVEQGGVVYCVLEGGIGFKNRVAAWKKQRGLEGQLIPFVAIPSGLNLLNPDADTPRLITAIKHAARIMEMSVKLVVIDTLARAMAGGNENAPDDMGALVLNMDKIRAETGACVMFIHHSGKDQAKGARGHSSLRAAIDTEIEVVDDEGAKTATVVKQREMKKGDVFGFTLRVVELGTNRHTEQVTTCIVDYGDDDLARAPRPRLTGHSKRALEVLSSLIAAMGRTGDMGVPSGYSSVPEKWWRDRFLEAAMPGSSQETKARTFSRVSSSLVEGHHVGMGGARVWVVRSNENKTCFKPDKTNLSDAQRYRNESEG